MRLRKIILCFVAFTVIGVFTLAYFVVFRNKPYTEQPPPAITEFRPTGAKTISLVKLSDEVMSGIPVYDYSPSAQVPVSPSAVSSFPGGSRYAYDWINGSDLADKTKLLNVYNMVQSMSEDIHNNTTTAYAEITDATQASELRTTYFSLGKIQVFPTNNIGVTAADLLPLINNSNPEDTAVIKMLRLAINSFDQDNPQLFIGMIGFSINYTTINVFGNTIITSAAVIPLFPFQYSTPGSRAQAFAKIESKFAEYKSLADTVTAPAEKIKLVHDKILTERDYAYMNYSGVYEPSLEVAAHNIMGVMAPEDFSPQYNPVCESYAKANAYILTRLGIECFTVLGDTNTNPSNRGYHAWNIIKIGNYWYWHDVTWDDYENTNPNNGNNYDGNNTKNDFGSNYFLRGSSGWANHYPNTSDISSSNQTTSYGVGMPSPFATGSYNVSSSYNWTKIPQIMNLDTVYVSNPSAFVPQITISGLTQGTDFTVVPLGTPAYSVSRFLIYGINTYRGVGLAVITLAALLTPAQPTNLYATYGQKLSAVGLTNGWHWVRPDDYVGDADIQTHPADFYGVNNYVSLYNISLSVTVQKATPNVSAPIAITATYGQVLNEIELPANWSWKTPANPVGSVGTRTHTAVYDLNNTNYNTVEKEVSVTVSKATPNVSVPVGITATYLQKLNEVALPSGWSWKKPTDTVGTVGWRTHAAIFTHVDTDNYKTVDANIYITVSPAMPTVSAPTGITAVYGQILSEIILPANWSWKTPANPVGTVGTQTHAAVFDLKNENFYTVEKDVSVIISKAAPSVSVPTGITAVYGHTLEDIKNQLPAGWSWKTPANPVGNVGTRTHAAIFTPNDTDNYTTVQEDISVIVSKATPSISAPVGITAAVGQMLSEIALPAGWTWQNPADTVAAEQQWYAADYNPDINNYNTLGTYISLTVENVPDINPVYPDGLTAVYGQTLFDVELPEGWHWQNPNDAVGSAGTQAHLADFYGVDGYTELRDVSLSVSVSKTVPAYITPADITAIYGQTLNEISLPAGWSWKTPAVPVGSAGAQTHTAIFTPDDSHNYTAVEAGIAVDVSKAVPSYTVPTGLTAFVGQMLSEIALPEGWKWRAPVNTVGDAGQRIHTAVFTPNDTLNYNTVQEGVFITVSAPAEPPEDPTDPPEPDPPEPTDPPEPGEQSQTASEVGGAAPKKGPDTEDIALAATSFFCLGLIVLTIRKFIFKK